MMAEDKDDDLELLLIDQLKLHLVDIENHNDETLIVSAKQFRIDYSQRYVSGDAFTRVTNLQIIPALINALSQLDYSKPDDAVERSPKDPTYQLEVRYTDGSFIRSQGAYVAGDVPADWADILQILTYAMYQLGLGEVFEPNRFKPKKQDGDLIYLTVVFAPEGPEYNYIADTDDYEVGDRVIVPVGADEQERVVTVTDVNYYQPEDAPYPPAKTRHVIGPVADDDDDYGPDDDDDTGDDNADDD